MGVEAWDRSDSAKLAEGSLQTVDNQIDTATGTIKLRAQFANTDEQLFPNQFVNVRLGVQTLRNATVIPAAAVQRGSFGTFVYVVKRQQHRHHPARSSSARRKATRSRSRRGSSRTSASCSRASTISRKGAKVQIIGEGAAPPAAGAAAPAEGRHAGHSRRTGGRGTGRRP